MQDIIFNVGDNKYLVRDVLIPEKCSFDYELCVYSNRNTCWKFLGLGNSVDELKQKASRHAKKRGIV